MFHDGQLDQVFYLLNLFPGSKIDSRIGRISMSGDPCLYSYIPHMPDRHKYHRKTVWYIHTEYQGVSTYTLQVVEDLQGLQRQRQNNQIILFCILFRIHPACIFL